MAEPDTPEVTLWLRRALDDAQAQPDDGSLAGRAFPGRVDTREGFAPGPTGGPSAGAQAASGPLSLSPALLQTLLDRLSGSTVGRAVGRAAATVPEEMGTAYQAGLANVRGGMAGLREQSTTPGVDMPMGGAEPNLGALGQAAWGVGQIAGAPVAGAARGLTELPLTLTEEARGTTRPPVAESLRHVAQGALEGALPMGLGSASAARGLGEVGAGLRGAAADVGGELGGVRNLTRDLREYQRKLTAQTRRSPAPDISDMRRLYAEGQDLGGGLWYHGFGDTARRIAGPEAEKYAGVVASLSPQSPAGALTESGMAALHPPGGAPLGGPRPPLRTWQEPSDIHQGSNLYVADRVWQAYQKGGIDEVARVIGPGKGPKLEPTKTVRRKGTGKLEVVPGNETTYIGPDGIGMTEDKVANVLRALRGERLGGPGDVEALKIRAFQRALLGDRDAVVLDSWMKRIFYPDSPSESFTAPQYAATQTIIESYAKELTRVTGTHVFPADVQAALWVAKKYAVEGATTAASGSLPFAESLRHVFIHHGRDLSVFGPSGMASIAHHLALAGLVLAAVKGPRHDG
jgi:hypothetical protein